MSCESAVSCAELTLSLPASVSSDVAISGLSNVKSASQSARHINLLCIQMGPHEVDCRPEIPARPCIRHPTAETTTSRKSPACVPQRDLQYQSVLLFISSLFTSFPQLPFLFAPSAPSISPVP